MNAFALSVQPLSADNAFQFSATTQDSQTILMQWQIAPGYYLYQKDFSFHVIKPKNTQLGNPLFPSNTEILKTAIGNYLVYSKSIAIPIPIINTSENNLVLQVHYQGCSKAGYCYPPISKVVAINLMAQNQIASGLNIDVAPIAFHTEKKSSNDKITNALTDQNIWMVLLIFLGLGILISFTPCVLPMIPILSSLILGKEKMSHAHAFFVSLFYVLGMAATYAAAGVLFGFIGGSVQALFQKTWIIAIFTIIFVLMALSLFGLFQIQLPETFRGKIAKASNQQKRNSFLGALIMGCLSTLILSPCVTPPLIAVLGYISQTSNAFLGGIILFCMGIGMGFPLLLIGAVGPKILPKTGSWMNGVKNILGILMLGVAALMAERILPETIVIIVWAGLCFGTSIYLGVFSSIRSKIDFLKKSIGLIIFIYGILILISAYFGNNNPVNAWNLYQLKAVANKLYFQPIRNLEDFNIVLHSTPQNKIILLDFYADWCVACKELETTTFSDLTVQQKLTHFKLLKIDVTNNSANDQLIEQHFGVVAPPTILFFQNGQEIASSRIIGYYSPKDFLKILSRIS